MGKQIASKRTNKNITVDQYKKKNKPQTNSSKPFQKKKSTSDIKQRHRFVKQNIRLQKIDISLLSKFDDLKVFPFSYSNDMIGSFFFDELETINMSNKTPQFRQWYNEIVDVSQSLPLILNNKTKILDHILNSLDDAYFQKYSPRLLISLMRDCGAEMYQDFIEKIFEKINDLMDITKVGFLQDLFMIFAAALKFLLKPIIDDFSNFVRVFIGGLLAKKNENIRRFTTEVLMYILKKIRNREDARIKFDAIFKMEFHNEFIQESNKMALKKQKAKKSKSEKLDGEAKPIADEAKPIADEAKPIADEEIDNEQDQQKDEVQEEKELDDSSSTESEKDEETPQDNEPFWSYEDILEDFRACMFFEFLKGHLGSFNPQIKDLIDILVDLVVSNTEICTSFVKAVNMFLDWEFKFFYNYNRNPHQKPTTGFYLEDFLDAFVGLSCADPQKQNACYIILQNILAFKKNVRVSGKIKELMAIVLSKTVLSVENQEDSMNIKNNYIKLAAKFIQNYGMVDQIFETIINFNDETVFQTFQEELLDKTTSERLTVWTRRGQKAKKHLNNQDEGFTFSLSNNNDVYNMLLQMILKILADQKFMDLIKNDVKSTCISKILLIFTMVHEKTKSGLSIRVDFDQNIAKNLKSWLNILMKNDEVHNFINMLTLIRLLRILNFKNSNEFITKISKLNKKLTTMMSTSKKPNVTDQDKLTTEKFETTLLSQYCYDSNFATVNNFPIYSNNIPTYETKKDVMLTLFSESCQLIAKKIKESQKSVFDVLANLLKLIENDPENLILLKAYHAVHTILSTIQNENEDNSKIQDEVFKIHDKMVPSFIKSLSTNTGPVRSCQLNILDLKKMSSSTEEYAEIFGYMRRLEAMKLDLQNERNTIMVFTNMKLDVLKSKWNLEQLKMIVYFQLGYSYNRLSTIHETLQDLLATILLKNRQLLYILFNTFIIKNLLFLRRNYWKEEDSNEQESLNEDIYQEACTGNWFTQNVNLIDILSKYYTEDSDPQDEENYLLRVMSIIKKVYNIAKTGRSSKKKNKEKYKKREAVDLAQDLSDEDENPEDEHPEEEDQKEKNESQKVRYTLLEEEFYNIFYKFLINEVEKTLIPNQLEMSRLRYDECVVSEVNKFDNAPSSQNLNKSNLDEYVCLMKKQEVNEHFKLFKSFVLKKLSTMIEIFNEIPRLAKYDFSQQKLKPILQELQKTKYTELQTKVLSCFLYVNSKNDILKQNADLLKGLINKQTLRDSIVEVGVSLTKWTNMEREELMPLVITIMFQKIFENKGTKNKKDLILRRSTLVNLLSHFKQNELEHIIKQLLTDLGLCGIEKISLVTDFGKEKDDNFKNQDNNKSSFKFLRGLCNLNKIHPSKVISFLNVLKSIITSLGSNLLEFIPALNEVIMYITIWSFEMSSLVKDDYAKVKELINSQKNNKVKDETQLSTHDKCLLRVNKSAKSIKALCLERISDFYVNYYEFDFNATTEELLEIVTSRIELLNKEASQKSKFSSLLKIFNTWSECELYKHYFLKYPKILEKVVAILHEPEAKTNVTNLIFQIIRNLQIFNVSDEVVNKFYFEDKNYHLTLDSKTRSSFFHSIDYFEKIQNIENEIQMPYIMIEEDVKVSVIGAYIIYQNVQCFLNGFHAFMTNSFANYQSNLDVESHGNKNFSKQAIGRLNSNVLEVSIMVSDYIDKKSSGIVENYLNFISPFQDPIKINKRTDKRMSSLKTANQMLKHEKELDQYKLLLNLFGTLLKNCENLSKWFYELVLPLIGCLRNKKLRHLLSNIFDEIVRNEKFDTLKIDKEVFRKFTPLFKIKRSMMSSENAWLDNDAILDLLNIFNENYNFKWNSSEKLLLYYNALSWVAEEELSVRIACMESLELFLNSLSSKINSRHTMTPQQLTLAENNVEEQRDLNFVRGFFINQILDYIRVHHGKEHIIKSSTLLMRKYIIFFLLKLEPKESSSMTDTKEFDLHDSKCYKLYDLVHVYNTDIEQDFFELVFNLKIDKRIRAFKFFEKIISNEDTKFSSSCVLNFFYPIMEYFAFDYWQDTNSPQTNSTRSKIDQVRGIITTIVKLYADQSRFQTFSQYLNLQKNKINKLVADSRNEQTYVRIVSAVLTKIDPNLPDIIKTANVELRKLHNKWHESSLLNELKGAYDNEDTLKVNEIRQETVNQIEDEVNNKVDDEEDFDLIATQLGNQTDKIENIQSNPLKKSQIDALRRKILAPLRKHMLDVAAENSQDKEKKVRIHVAIAIVKLIRVLPLNVFKSEFVRVINNISVILQSRDNEVRESARKALLEILIETGPFFIHFVLNELKYHLSKGYMLHVRNYTIHYLLKNLTARGIIELGSIDYCLDIMIPMVIEEIYGGLSEEKQVKEIKNKSIEFKGKFGYDCFYLIGQKINFQGESQLHIFKMIEYQLKIFGADGKSTATLADAVNKSGELFKQLTEGLLKNESVETESVFLLTYAMNQRAIELLEHKAPQSSNEIQLYEEFDSKVELRRNNLEKTYKLQEGAASGKSLEKMAIQKSLSRENLIGKVLANFIMILFQRCLRKGVIKFDFSNYQTKKDANEKFDPLIDQFLKQLNSDYNDIVLISLNIIAHVINFPLFSIRKNNKRILKSQLKILSTLQSNDLQQIQICFKMIKKLIKSNRFNLKDSHITQVFNYIKEYIYPADWVTEPLNCLETLITVKMIKSDIYDLIDRSFEIMLVSMDPGIINTCKRCILKFIENFPLTEELYEKYFSKLIKNIDFPEETGRKTVLSIIELLVRKLPDEFLQKFIDLYYFSLVTRYINEESLKIKSKLTETIVTQLKRICFETDSDGETILIKTIEGTKVSHFIKTGLIWSKQTDVNLKSAGFYSLSLIWQQIEHLGKPYLMSVEILDILEAEMDEINADIEEFFQQIKDKKDLKEKLRDNPWSSVLNDEEDQFEIMTKIKHKELLVNMGLQFIVVFIKNTSTGSSSKDDINMQKRAIAILLQLRKHPQDDVQMNLQSLLRILFRREDECEENEQPSGQMEIQNEVRLSKEVITHLTKDFLMFIFAIIKKKFLTVELCGDLLKDCLCGFLMNFSYNPNFLKKLLQMITEGFKQIIVKCCKKVTREAPVIEKVILLVEGILIMFDKQRPKLFPDQTKINKEKDDEWMGPIFNILAKLRENGNVKAMDYIYNKLEILIEKSQEVTDERYFVKELAKNVREINEVKAENRSKNNEFAITDPKAYTKEKLKKQLRSKARKKEIIRQHKFGTIRNKFTTGENVSVKKLKTK